VSARRFALLLLVLCATAAPAPVLAQELVEIDEETDAQSAFRSGQSKFQRENYSGAMESFREAYAIDPRPELLYNIGESADRADLLVDALEAFEAYLAEISDVHPRRRAIERRVVELRDAIARGEGDDGDAGAGPWVIAGLGAASAITGGILLGVGIAERSAADNPEPGTPPAEVEDQRSRANTMTGVGIAMLTVGALALAGGLYWGVSSGSSGRGDGSEDAEVEVAVGPASVLVRGRF